MHTYDKTLANITTNSETSFENLQVLGDVGEESIVEANHLKIDGRTMKGSTQFSRFSHINTHQGKLRCHEAIIGKLIDGEVNATKVTVDECEGGFIYAQHVHIMNVTKPVTIVASHTITIQSVTCSNSSFKINYKEVPILNSKMDLIQEDLAHLNEELEDVKKHNVSKIEKVQAEIDILHTEHQEIINSYKNAKITFQNTLAKDNRIIFTIKNGNELQYISQNTQKPPFSLQIAQNKILLQPLHN